MSKFLDSLGLTRLIQKLKSHNIDGMGLSTNDFSNADKSKLDSLAVQVPSNWNETNSNSKAFIQNKPTKLSQFTNDPNFVKNSEIDNIIAEKTSQLIELVIDPQYYSTVIDCSGGSTDGQLINGLRGVTISCNVSKTEFSERGNSIKFIRFTKEDKSRTTLMNMTFTMPSAGVFCAYCFNKVADGLGTGYATFSYSGNYTLKITTDMGHIPT